MSDLYRIEKHDRLVVGGALDELIKIGVLVKVEPVAEPMLWCKTHHGLPYGMWKEGECEMVRVVLVEVPDDE